MSSRPMYSPDALKKWLTIGAILLALSGYALPWYKSSVSAYIVNIRASFYIWGMSGGASAFLGQSRSFTATWFNLPSEIASGFVSEGGIGFVVAFIFYVLASLLLLGSISGSRSSTIASAALLLLAILSYVGTISYLNTQPSYVPIQQGYGEGLSVAIIAALLSGGAVAIPFLKGSASSMRYPSNVYCQNCGHKISADSSFCPYCGKKIERQ